MPIRHSARLITLAAILVVAALLPAAASAQFQLGLEDNGFNDPLGSPGAQIAFGALDAVHGSVARVYATWGVIAPSGTSQPAGFDATNPADPHYNWTAMDTAVRDLTAHGDRVILNLTGDPSPAWATPPGEPSADRVYPGSWNPDATDFGKWARAAAKRYSGSFPDPLNAGRTLPRVSMWETWNEENLPQALMAPNLVEEYRALLNAGYPAIKSVHSSNTVAIGGFAPVSYENISVSPLKFAAQLLCLRRIGTRFIRASICPAKARFDVLATHPYSLLATPTKHAYHYDDLLVGDASKVDALLSAAERLHTAAGAKHYGQWVTEWSWFTNPPNTLVGDPDPVAARYTAYSVYEMWKAGVSIVIWYSVRDLTVTQHTAANAYGLGLYYASGQPKLVVSAFQFPVVAGVSGGRGFVWGRAPVSVRTRVVIQRQSGRGWRIIGAARTGSDGVFTIRFAASGNATYRAYIPHGAVSLGYNSTPIPPVRTHA